MAEFTPDIPAHPDTPEHEDTLHPLRQLTDALGRLNAPEQNIARERLDLRQMTRILNGLLKELKGRYDIRMPDIRNLQITPNGYPQPLQLRLPQMDRFTNMGWSVSPLEQLLQGPLANVLRQTFGNILQRPSFPQMPVYNINWYSQQEPLGGSIYLPYDTQACPPFSLCNGTGNVPYAQPHNPTPRPTVPYAQPHNPSPILPPVNPGPMIARKPVIYLYPTKTTDVTVGIDLPGGQVMTEYPVRTNGVWSVKAETDGSLKDANGSTYDYLFWEGLLGQDLAVTPNNAACVPNAEYTGFLESSLARLGLNARERNDFIVYWLPLMQKYPYALVRFCGADYAAQAPLSIVPNPESLIRVFMAFQGSQAAVDAKGQTLSEGKRSGFTVVEWGGTEIDAGNKRLAK